MKYMLFLLFFFMPATLYGQVFKPYVELSQENRGWSGVVYEEDETKYYVLSCAHGIISDQNIVQVTLYNNNPKSNYRSIGVKADILRSDHDLDLALLSIEKFDKLFKIKKLKLGKDRPKVGKKMEINGYYLGEFKRTEVVVLEKNLDIINDLKYKTEICSGVHYSGMSGSPLEDDGVIYGIQLAKSKDEQSGFHASILMINEFLKK
ncbi:MAG TPA: serine protease [Allocoleopsis sp.]